MAFAEIRGGLHPGLCGWPCGTEGLDAVLRVLQSRTAASGAGVAYARGGIPIPALMTSAKRVSKITGGGQEAAPPPLTRQATQGPIKMGGQRRKRQKSKEVDSHEAIA